MANEKLAELIVKRSSIKGQVTKFKNYLDKLSRLETITASQRAELVLKLNKFEALSSKFDDLQSEIEVSNAGNLANELKERDGIEEEFICSVVVAQNLLEKYVKTEDRRESFISPNVTHCTSDHNSMGFKLPLIQIAKFDGSYLRWMEFRDTFKSLIHENERISVVHKFHYLVSYLEGEAARSVSNLEISSNNYQQAWDLLLERYDNKRLLISHHLSALFNINSINRESEGSLRFLVDHVTKNLRALSSLGQATQHWDVMIIHLVASKLDHHTFRKWEEHRNTLSTDAPTLRDFHKFLNERAAVLESLHRGKAGGAAKAVSSQPRPAAPASKPERPHTKSYTCTNNKGNQQSNFYQCVCCDATDHRIYDCPSFKAKSISERMTEVSKLKLCGNCLKSGHTIRQCRFGPCRECNKRHNTMLHLPVNTDSSEHKGVDTTNTSETMVGYSNQPVNQAILSTALIVVENPKTRKTEIVRALLDCGSQSSFITSNLKQRLSLTPCSTNSTNIIGFGNNTSGTVTEYCIAQIKAQHTSFNVVSGFYVMKDLTGLLPNTYIDIGSFKIPKNIMLADPKFYEPSNVDVLIGSDLFWDIIGCEQQSLGSGYPRLHSSRLGWLIGGPLPCSKRNKNTTLCNHILTNSLQNHDPESSLNRFWELEEIPTKTFLSDSEQACEQHFLQHTCRLEGGRFCVKLPLISSPDCLGDSYTTAKKRFYNLEKRFRKQPEVKSQYIEFIREYEALGHLSEIILSEPVTNLHYFLPHHPVFKQNSETTKMRVVFDASARTSSGLSVNDLQMIGPQIQDSLFSILIRARHYRYIFTADVEKMYRQIVVHESDRHLQLILWREAEHQPLRTLQLNTVTYGFASASYLSTRCLWQLGEECEDPLTKTIVQHDIYADDIITGCNSESELMQIQRSVSEALRAGCFNLRKYKSNSIKLLESCSSKSTDAFIISESASALGLGWDSKTDRLHYSLEFPPNNDIISKRYILSTSSKIFDPLGFISPCIVIPKLIMQQLWLDKVGWDDPLPRETEKAWLKFYGHLPHLSLITLPRRVICDLPILTELHTFSDASQRAYGACIYIRSVDATGNVHVNLLCSKSKVAPVKPCTIPRLELCAAVLAVRLCKAVAETLRVPIERKFHWCDSSVVLSWMHTSSRKLKTFVANRISEILEGTTLSSWRYVHTTDNPADLISRGVYPAELKDNNLWWSGPSFLLLKEDSWPTLHNSYQQESDLPELKSHLTRIDNDSAPIVPFDKFSTLFRLKRVYAYVLRFIHNMRNPKSKQSEALTIQELRNSFNLLCRMAQQESFHDEYTTLIKKMPLSSRSSILSLTPFIDTNGLIRVGGRLDASSLSFDGKHPILLHSSHQLTKLIFEREHLHKMHAGPQLLLASVREYVWPINGRHLARRTVHNCVRCRRVQGKTLTPLMGNLPSERVTVDFPFRSVGIDFAGPFLVLNRKGRGSRTSKCYLCIFICLRYKCVHLEAVSDLSSDAFILTLRRFISRRGKPIEIFCDNGRNFVAAAKDIGMFFKCSREAISEFTGAEEINFSFSPPYAAHFGGIWEAGVKSAKFHIRHVMANTHLTYEELSTLFAQVEAILNSRPLYPMSSSPNDLHVLTPGHFLIGRSLTTLPSPNLIDCNSTNLKRYERLEQIRQHFWRRWQHEYLAELQQKSKWRKEDKQLAIGDLVLLHEENLPPLCWRLGRITKLFPGPDGVCRVADVQTSKGSFRRSFTRLCPLPATEHLIES